jgi:hypothetical protein
MPDSSTVWVIVGIMFIVVGVLELANKPPVTELAGGERIVSQDTMIANACPHP